jgi:amino acid adenylation domain-containing protein
LSAREDRPVLLHHVLERAAGTLPDQLALIDGASCTTYAELDRAATCLAGALQAAGIERGDRVATLLENSADAVVAIWGILRSGAVLVPLPPLARPPRIAFVLRDCGVKAVVASPDAKPALFEALRSAGTNVQVFWSTPPRGCETEPSLRASLAAPPCGLHELRQIDNDLAAIIYTSGTTGEPKGVMLTHRNLVNTSGVIARYLGNNPDDMVVCVLPLAFSYGLCQVLAAAQTTHSLQIERSFAFPYDVLRRAAANRATGFPAVPTIFAKIMQVMPTAGIDLSSLRYLTNAAAPMPPAHVRKIREVLPHAAFFSMYGQTECTRATYLDPALIDTHPGCSGRAIPNCEVYLVDALGTRLPAGSEGELVVRGANVMRGYWDRPVETACKLRDGEIAGEKVLHTGDVFRSDAAGLLTFVSRSDDVFKCRGEKVAPREIENELCELPDVSEAVVVGVPDDEDGMAIKAVVVARPGSTLSVAQVRQHCRARLEPGLMPKFIEIRAELPKTESGKLRARDLATR